MVAMIGCPHSQTCCWRACSALSHRFWRRQCTTADAWVPGACGKQWVVVLPSLPGYAVLLVQVEEPALQPAAASHPTCCTTSQHTHVPPFFAYPLQRGDAAG